MSVVAAAGPPGRPRFVEPPLSPEHADALAAGVVGPDHKARLILAALRRLDLSCLLASYNGRGSDAYPPLPLLAVAVYQAHEGHFSPTLWLKHSRESIPVRWLLRGLFPSRSAWYAFRDRLPLPLLDLAHQAVKAALAEGLITADRAAVDGTLLAANSTRHHLLNAQVLARRLKALDAADAAAAPCVASPGFVGKTAAGRARQRRHYSRLEEELRRRQLDNQMRPASKRRPVDGVRISPGDPEAVLGLDKQKVYRPLYNVQLLADVDSPFVLSYQVVAQASDAGLLGGLLSQTRAGLGVVPEVALADSGYASGGDLADAETAGVSVYSPWQSNDYSKARKAKKYDKQQFTYQAESDHYVCPAGKSLALHGVTTQQRAGGRQVELRLYRAEPSDCQGCPRRGECTSGKTGRTVTRTQYEPQVQALRERMATDEAKALYRLRKQTVERLNADFKQHRQLRRFCGRGLAAAQAEVGLAVLAHNLMALIKLRDKAKAAARPTQTPP